MILLRTEKTTYGSILYLTYMRVIIITINTDHKRTCQHLKGKQLTEQHIGSLNSLHRVGKSIWSHWTTRSNVFKIIPCFKREWIFFLQKHCKQRTASFWGSNNSSRSVYTQIHFEVIVYGYTQYFSKSRRKQSNETWSSSRTFDDNASSRL